MVLRGAEEGELRCLIGMMEFCWEDEKVLEIDGDSCTMTVT